ncbi:MAG: type II toxin-antitoxin system death-on-curing family toxin [Kineosporiaceae bacterium]|nr:type II toxin-antitoxin system death-on-curing family toxin [Aeromicrobium sp.]
MTIYLTIEEALAIAARATGAPPLVRDLGLIESALARPRTTVFGEDAYPTLDHKAAALLQSLVGNHGLVDGNKRLALACTSVFLTINGHPLELNDASEAYDLVIAVATGELVEVGDIAQALRGGT